MPEKMKRVLVVSGDYEITRQVRQVLQNSAFEILVAYSHRDAVYTLDTQEVDLIFVDGLMADRRTGELTAQALARLRPKANVVALSSVVTTPSNLFHASPTDTAILESAGVALNDDTTHKQRTTSGSRFRFRPTEEIEALFDLGKSLTEVLDLEEVLNRVVEAARHLTGAEEGLILLPGDEEGQLYLRAKVGIDVEFARNFSLPVQDTLAGRVFSSGQPLLIGGQGPQKIKTQYLVSSLLYVPIMYEGKCNGVLGVSNRVLHSSFDSRHQELLINLAAFAAIAIENARIHEVTVARTEELKTLVEASQVLSASLALEDTLPKIVTQLKRVLNVGMVRMYTFDETGSKMGLLIYNQAIAWPVGQEPSFSPKQRPGLKNTLAEGKPTFLTNPHLLKEHVLTCPGMASVYTFPMLREVPRLFHDTISSSTVEFAPAPKQVLGAVQVFFRDEGGMPPLPDAVLRAQTLVGDLFSKMFSRGRPSTDDMMNLLQNIINALNGDGGEVLVLTSDQTEVLLTMSSCNGLWSEAEKRPSLDLSTYPELWEAAHSPTFVLQKAGDTRNLSIQVLLDMTRCHSLLAIPLILRREAKGLFLFGDARRNRVFRPQDIGMAKAITGQIGTMLEKVTLIQDLEKSLRELRDTQSRLVQSARLSAMGELAAAVAHQINNPLTTINVDSEMMLMYEKPDSPNYKSLQAILRAGKRAAGVAKRLLAISRPQDPESPPVRIDVMDTIEGVLSLVRAHIERKHIEVVVELPPERLPPVMAVPGQVDDIWLNLLMNAHDALGGLPNARMGINAQYLQDRREILVKVWDNGPGIPEKIIDEIFKPFFTTKPIGEGTGLGLHICRQTIERIGGSIQVISKPNEGTTFLVYLPVNVQGEDFEL